MRTHNVTLAGRSILIVEDEPLIALEIHAAFNAAGASVIIRVGHTSHSTPQRPLASEGRFASASLAACQERARRT
jgi:hypothetical protein